MGAVDGGGVTGETWRAQPTADWAGSQRRAGFETTITVNTQGPYFAVTADDAGGHVLAQSATVSLEK